jgi:hypothetical protein
MISELFHILIIRNRLFILDRMLIFYVLAADT